MTEQEWLESDDTRPMLEFLRGKASERKMRLFACACCRRVWNLLIEADNESAQRAVITAERFADGFATKKELNAAKKASYKLFGGEGRITRSERQHNALGAAWSTTKDAFSSAMDAVWLLEGIRPKQWVVALRCEVFGNPFRPVSLDRALLTTTIVGLANAVYDDRAFDQLPILADALEEAGCTNADILAHCRGPGPHARGCWVVDLLLGKE